MFGLDRPPSDDLRDAEGRVRAAGARLLATAAALRQAARQGREDATQGEQAARAAAERDARRRRSELSAHGVDGLAAAVSVVAGKLGAAMGVLRVCDPVHVQPGGRPVIDRHPPLLMPGPRCALAALPGAGQRGGTAGLLLDAPTWGAFSVGVLCSSVG